MSQLAAVGGTGAASWSIIGGALPPGVALDANGTVSSVSASIGTFTVTVQAVDVNYPADRASSNVALVVSAPIFSATVTGPAAARVGVPYQATAAASGLIGGITWSVAAGGLPPGVALNAASGAIAGVPTASGSFAALIQARDSYDSARVAAASLSVVVESSATEIVLYAADATTVTGTWSRVADATAAGGARLWNRDRNKAKLMTALAAPANYFELTFNAQAGVAYHLWMRGKADKNSWANDSVFVQFSGSLDARGAAVYRIGTTSATWYSVEDGASAGVSGWGWNDDAYDGLAAPIYFATTGPQTIRVQVREDGLSLDQIVLSAKTYLTTSPGAFKDDATILPR